MKVFLGLLAIVVAVLIGDVNGTECFYCANGSTNDILKLIEVYGGAELHSDGFAQSTRTLDAECGKEGKKNMKPVKCPNGCVIAEFADHSVFSGCAREPAVYKSLSTHRYNELQFRMAICSTDECNDSFESALKNVVKPTGQPSTVSPSTSAPVSSSTAQILEANSTNIPDGSSTTGADHPKSTLKPKGKPNSAASIGVSVSTLLVGLVAYLLF